MQLFGGGRKCLQNGDDLTGNLLSYVPTKITGPDGQNWRAIRLIKPVVQGQTLTISMFPSKIEGANSPQSNVAVSIWGYQGGFGSRTANTCHFDVGKLETQNIEINQSDNQPALIVWTGRDDDSSMGGIVSLASISVKDDSSLITLGQFKSLKAEVDQLKNQIEAK